MIKCLIVDDELLARQVIENYVQKTAGLELVAQCGNAQEASEILKTREVDLIFLDIQLPGMTGLHFLGTLQSPPLVILTTAFAEYALESYEFSVIDYLLKPISYERFTKAIEKILRGRLFSLHATQHEQAPTDHIFIKSGNKFFRVNFSEIIFIEAMKDYLKIQTAEYRLVTLQTMNEMEKMLPSNQFLRVHKSYIVSISHIRSVYGGTIELDKMTIPIGLNYKNSVMSLISRK
jgi:DNA-binding LytR/AlgR family response regulator